MKLNIGSGNAELEGYVNLDKKTGGEAFPLSKDSVRYADECADEIRASHILEHFSFAEVPQVLAEWFRVLKPGGQIFVAVPDLLAIAQCDVSDAKKARYAMGGQVHDYDFHKAAFTESSLAATMQEAGFEEISAWKPDGLDSASNPISARLQGRKPGQSEAGIGEIKTCAILSIPRLGWNDHWGCVIDALRPFNIPIRRFTGAFWHHCIQTAFEESIEHYDWILSLDYDTLFTSEELSVLMDALAKNPQADAVAALQLRRNTQTPLCTIKGQDRMEVSNGLTKVDTAHFGLTLFRSEAFEGLPKPWFLSVPGPDGTFSHDEHIDPDIYFWKQWQKHGRSIYMVPAVSVGHLECVVSELDENYNPRWTSMKDWAARAGKDVR